MCHQNVVWKFGPDCVRSNLRVKIFLGGGACPQTPLVGMHTYMCMSVLSHATIILLPLCFLPQLKILYETLTLWQGRFTHTCKSSRALLCIIACNTTLFLIGQGTLQVVQL